MRSHWLERPPYGEDMAKKAKEKKSDSKKQEPKKTDSKKTKSKKDYAGDYNKQTLSVSSHIVYNPPEGESGEDHYGLPGCYPCCGTTGCRLACVGIVAAAVVCCAYVSRDGTCCTYCQWPF